MTDPLWQPARTRIAGTNLVKFLVALREQNIVEAADFDQLYRFSIERPDAFWRALWDFCAIKAEKRGARTIEHAQAMPGARFFPDAVLNYADNMLPRRDDGPALIFRGEDKCARTVSWSELYDQVSRASQALRAAGVVPGDRVAAIMPNMPETIIGVLATAAIGAVWSSCSPDFGPRGILDRFGQIDPKILIACDGYWYNGKRIDIADKLAGVIAEMPGLERIIVVDYLGDAAEVAARIDKAETLESFITPHPPGEIEFHQAAFDHPLYILFSSGTTGVPKCIVHSAGGTLMQHVKEIWLHTDVKPGDRLFYFSTCGWMMWNWLVSGLQAGATLLLYDGSPFYPDGNALFDFADEAEMTTFGTSAKYIDAVKKAGLRPKDTHKLETLRTMMSTGSPLSAESFEYVYDAVKSDICLSSISGGTDIVSCFVQGNPTGPVWAGEIQAPGLGLAVDVFDEAGVPLKSGKGELVCIQPFPSMPLKFWNDPQGRKYHAAYFDRFPGVWCHGDFAEWTEHGGMIIHGRSDATLNPGGVRIGTAELYAQVEQMPEIKEAIAVGQEWDNDVRIILFVVLADNVMLDDPLIAAVKQKIRSGASPRHVPAKVIQVADIPRTKSGKITELAVRDIIHGREVKNQEALANPEALEHYRGLKALEV